MVQVEKTTKAIIERQKLRLNVSLKKRLRQKRQESLFAYIKTIYMSGNKATTMHNVANVSRPPIYDQTFSNTNPSGMNGANHGKDNRKLKAPMENYQSKSPRKIMSQLS